MSPTYSWIVPIYNEAQSLSPLLNQIQMTMRSDPFEVIVVNDGSTDATGKILKTCRKKYSFLRIITLPIRQGKWIALARGLDASTGDKVITIDGDLQDDPGEIPKLLAVFNQGYDLVSGWRMNRKDAWYKTMLSRLGNRLVSVLTRNTFYDLNAPMKLYHRSVLMSLPREGSLLRFSLLFAHKLGYKTVEIPIVHRRRLYGVSKFGFIKYIRIIYDLLLIHLLFSGSGQVRKPA